MRKQLVVSLMALTTLGVAATAQQGGPQAGGGPAAGPRQPTETRQFETPPMPFMPNDGLGETDQPLMDNDIRPPQRSDFPHLGSLVTHPKACTVVTKILRSATADLRRAPIGKPPSG